MHPHNRYVAHVDILGMSSIVMRDPEEAWGLLSDLVAALDDVNGYVLDFISLGERTFVPDAISHVTFSDTIVLFTRSDSHSDLRALLVAVTALFHRALVKCVPIRVGVAEGVFFFNHKKSMYCGPALVEAYHAGESAQWLGISLTDKLAQTAKFIDVSAGKESKLLVQWDIPIKSGSVSGYALNWAAAVEYDLDVETPLSVEQFYEAFERCFGPFNLLPDDVKRKYINAVEFANAHFESKA